MFAMGRHNQVMRSIHSRFLMGWSRGWSLIVLLLLSSTVFSLPSVYAGDVTITSGGGGDVTITGGGGGGGGSGDVTDVGDCTGNACFNALNTGTTITFSNATSGTIALTPVSGALGTRTISLPAETGTLCTTGSVCSGYQASLGFTAVATTRTISTTAPLSGGGDLSANRTLAFDYSATLAANPALAANRCVFSTTGLICEGATATSDDNETLITVTDPTADRTFTIPDANSNPVRP